MTEPSDSRYTVSLVTNQCPIWLIEELLAAIVRLAEFQVVAANVRADILDED